MMRPVPALAAALLTFGCVRPEPEGPPEPRAILLVTLEATRADRLGAYGYGEGATPSLDALAEVGATFTRAYTTSPQTLPSHASLLTGLNPPSHGVRDTGDYRLPERVITLAERFRDAGWRTLAFTPALQTHRTWGLDQGFDRYHDRVDRQPRALDWEVQARADELIDDVLDTLDAADDDRSTFVWVHLYDPHWPHAAPEPWSRQHQDPYDAELAFLDHELGRLLARWEERDPERSWVVVTADHGEALGDGGEQTHGFLLHDATLHVPLLVRGPGFEPGSRPDEVVSHVDVAPTLLGLAGLPAHPGLQGRDLRRGGSGWAWSESQLGRVTFGLAPLTAYTDPDGRTVRGAWTSFHPVTDGGLASQGQRLDPSDPVVRKLTEVQASLANAVPEHATLDAQTLEMLTALGYPVAGDPADPGGAIDPRDVVDALPLALRVRERLGTGLSYQANELLDELEQRLPGTYGVLALEAQILFRQRRFEQARAAWERIYLAHPTATVAMQLAALSSSTGDWHGAAGWYDTALREQPGSPRAAAGRARAAWMLGDDDTAEARISELLVVHPDHPELSLLRGELLLRQGELDAALEEARAGSAALPWSPWGPYVVGGVLWERGRPEQAVEALQLAVSLDPHAAAVRLRLTEFLLELGRHPEAVRIVAPLARAAPDDEAIQGVYHAARTAITLDDRYRLRVNRARGPAATGR